MTTPAFVPGLELTRRFTPKRRPRSWPGRPRHPPPRPPHQPHPRRTPPEDLHGRPTNFAPTGEPRDIRGMRTTDGPVHHRVEITDIPTWFRATLGFDPTQGIADEEAFAGRCGEVGDELGSFIHTPQGAHPTPILTAALTAPDCRPRETHLSTAYETLAGLHNQLGLTTRPYHFRPFRVLRADRFAEALVARATSAGDAGKPRPEGS